MKCTRIGAVLLGFLVTFSLAGFARATTYYVRVDGNDANRGTSDTRQGAWRSVSRGQPTRLLGATEKGQREIIVEKFSHFPDRGVLVIDKKRVRYTGKLIKLGKNGRKVRVFTGCRNVPKAPKGTMVQLGGFRGFKGGDEIVITEGTYAAGPGMDREPLLAVYAGGTAGKPLTYRARGRVLLDCRNNLYSDAIAIRADNVRIEGFECRRSGGIFARGKNIEITACTVNDVDAAVKLASGTTNARIHHNIIYAYCNIGISLDRVNGAHIHHNTLHGIKRGIVLTRSTKIRINHNLVSRTKYEAIIFKGAQDAAEVRIENNNFWANKTDVWLRKSQAFAKGVKPGKGNTFEVPMIASFKDGSPNFFRLAASSPLLAAGIGARGKAVAEEPPSRLDKTVSSTHNLVSNSGFEAGLNGWRYSTASRFWDDTTGVAVDENEAFRGKRSLCLWTPKEQSANPGVTGSIVPLKYGETYTLSVYARSAEPGAAGAAISIVRPSWHGAIRMGTFRIPSSRLDRTWRRFSKTFTVDYKWAEDGMVNLGVRYGKVWFDCEQLEKGDMATPYGDPVELTFTTDHAGNLVPPGGTIHCAAENTLDVAVKGDLAIRFEDIWDKVVFEKRLALELAGGEKHVQNIPVPNRAGGLVFARWSLDVPAQKFRRRGVFRFAVGKPAPITEDYFFASTPHMEHLPYDWVARFGPAISAYGVTTFRAYLGERDLIQYTRRGVSRYDRYLSDGKKYGIKMLVTLDDQGFWKRGKRAKGDPWATNERLKSWLAIARPFVKRYGDRIKVWEITNESNCYSPQADGTPFTADQYVRIFKPTCKAIKDAHADNTVLGVSITIHYGQKYSQEAVAKCSPFYDGLSFHPYGGEWRLLPALEALRGYQKKAGHEKPIWFTEEYSTIFSYYDRASWPYDAEDVQSAELQPNEVEEAITTSRLYLISLGEGVKSYTYHTYPGLITDSAYTPHARLKALHTMKTLLGRARPVRRMKLGDAFEGYVFADEKGRAIVAVWPEDYLLAKPMKAVFPVEVDRAYDFVGGPLSVRNAGSGAEIELPISIAYVISQKTSPENLARAFEKALGKLSAAQ